MIYIYICNQYNERISLVVVVVFRFFLARRKIGPGSKHTGRQKRVYSIRSYNYYDKNGWISIILM